MADRVMDTRCCEQSPSTMTVNDLRALAKFMHALNKESSSSQDQDQYQQQQQQQQQQPSPSADGSSDGSTPQRLGRIFPFTSSFYHDNNGQQTEPWIRRTAHRLSWALGNTDDEDASIMDPDSSIQFDGWSLWFFSPSSKTRLYLWMVIASRWYEVLSLLLLFIQWLTLSSMSIRNHTDKSAFSPLKVSILGMINVVVLFEMIAKVVVYGLALTKMSTSPPSIKDNIKTLFMILGKKNQNYYERRISSPMLHRQEDRKSDIRHHHPTTQVSSSSSSIHSAIHSFTNSSRQPPWGSPTLHPDDISHEINHSLWPQLQHQQLRRSSLSSSISSSASKQQPQHPSSQSSLPFLPGFENNSSSVSSDRRPGTQRSSTPSEKSDAPSLELLKISHRPFLTSTRHILDLVSVLAFLSHLFGSNFWGSFLAALSTVRILRFLTITEGTAIIMQSLWICFDILCNVLGFFVFFWLLFSLLALNLFSNSFSRLCAVIPEGGLYKNIENLVYANPEQRCNSFYDTTTSDKLGVFDVYSGTLISSRSSDGYTCQLGQACIQSAGNQPGWTHINYDNIFYSMLNVFTVVSTENWTDLMYMSQDSVSTLASSLFYCICLYLMTFILVPMFIAVITTSFSNLRGTLRQSAFARNRKTRILLSPSANKDVTKDHQRTATTNEGEDDWVYEGYHGTNNQFRRNSHRLQHWMNAIASSRWCVYLGSSLVVANTVLVAIYSSELPDQETSNMYMLECIFCVIFSMEIVLRIIVSGNLPRFWHSTRNKVDTIIIVGCLFNTLFISRSSQFHQFLQIFVLARSYRLIYFFPSVLQLLSDVIGDGQGIINLTFFTFVVLFLFSPIAMQLFGGDFEEIAGIDDPVMRFDNFYQSFLSLFQIMTGENWTDILYDAMESQAYATVVFAGLFMLLLYFAIHYMVLNLFIAVIMENFDLEEDEIRQIQIKKYIRQHRWQPEYFQLDIISRFLLPVFVKQDHRRLKVNDLPQSLVALVKKSEFHQFLVQEDNQEPQLPFSRQSTRSNSLSRRRSLRRTISNASVTSTQTMMPSDVFVNQDVSDRPVKYGDEYELNVAKENKAVVLENISLFRSMVLLKPNHPIRQWVAKITHHQFYQNLMMGFVCLSLILAIYTDDTFRIHHPSTTYILESIQISLLAIFFVDIVTRMVDNGIIMLPESYLRNIWNVLELASLLSQVGIMVYWEDNHGLLTGASILRCLRILRIMHLVNYIQGMRIIFLDIMYGLPKLLDAVALNLIVFIPFAIYGCFIFGGRFSLCNDGVVNGRRDCLGEWISTDDDNQDILVPRIWSNPYQYSFDSFGKALLHLFECASGEGWILSLFTAMSVPTTVNTQPKFNWFSSSVLYSLYYIVFMFVASLCTLQLFIGVFLETFKQRSGISSLTNAQRQFQDLQRQLSLVKPSRKADRPDGTLRAMCYDLVIDRHGKFAQMMALVSMANIVVFASRFLHQPTWMTYLQERLYHGFLIIYTLEILVKILGLGLNKLTSSRWNIYDIVVVTWAISTSVLKVLLNESFALVVMFSLAQICIVFRLAQRIDSLDTLLRATQKALPSIAYVTGAFVLVMLGFAVIFQELFDWTRYGPYGNHNANFRTLTTSFLTLFRITTGENWDFLMHDYAVQSPDCVPGRDCGSPIAAYTLFILFYVLCTYIFVNLFTVVVISNFSFTFDKRNKFTLLTRADLRYYKQTWEDYDPRATGFIQKDQIPGFLRSLQGNLSMQIYSKAHSLTSLLKASDQMDADVTHIASVPLCSSRLQNQFASNNILGERYYNYYEVNKKLQTMDIASVRINKETYNRVYQEILLMTTPRGIAFHDMLQILALRLVDVTKSLTFVGFVEWSRQQEVIRKKLATEKATNAVNMLIQRRQYIKELQQMHNNQMMDISLYANWPSPAPSGISSTGTFDYEPRRHASVIIDAPEGIFPKKDDDNEPFSDETSSRHRHRSSPSIHSASSSVPAIIVNCPPSQQQQHPPPHQIQHEHLSPPHSGSITQPSPLSSPNFFPNVPSPEPPLPIHPTTTSDSTDNSPCLSPHAPSYRSPLSPPLSPNKHLAPWHDSLPQELALSRRSWQDLMARRSEISSPNLQQDHDDVDTFTLFYALDPTMDNMASPDVTELLGQLEHSQWSELLREETKE
ncbi:Ion transport protein-domain-containing protein [Chlamydoabsidia padenii]|nr:Ion transport protein-domain-containing protein [Chlamydoabsidia padenii]